jgi:guanyl-specific ribonuclease Sa
MVLTGGEQEVEGVLASRVSHGLKWLGDGQSARIKINDHRRSASDVPQVSDQTVRDISQGGGPMP